MESPSALCEYVGYGFFLAARSCRDPLQPRPKLLLQQIEDEEARFYIWAASVGVSKLEGAFPAEHLDVNEDAREEITRMLRELSGYLNEWNHRTDELSDASASSDEAQDAMDIGEDELVSETQEPDEPDDFGVASMLLAAIHDVLNSMYRLATSIYSTAGHFDLERKSVDEMIGLLSPGALTVMAEEDGTSGAKSHISTRLAQPPPSSERQSFGSVRFCVSWKHIAIHRQRSDRPSFYRDTSLLMPPVIKDGFEVFISSSAYSWTPGSLRSVSTLDEKYLRIHRTSSLVWCPDHQTYLTVPYDCTEINVRDKAAEDELDNWERVKFNHEWSDGLPLRNIGHRYSEDVGAGPSSWLGELIPYNRQRFGVPAVPGAHVTIRLAGDLSLLLGLVALSTTPDQTKDVIETSFWPSKDIPGWVTHGQSIEHRTREVGIVFNVFVDTREPNASKTALEKWESGENGPILA